MIIALVSFSEGKLEEGQKILLESGIKAFTNMTDAVKELSRIQGVE